MLRLEGVTAQAGSFRLERLDMEIPSGACHALLGPSGSGKSTLLELIVGFRELQSGRIFLNRKDLARMPVEQRNIGYLPQQLALFPHLTVRENILYGIRCRRKPSPADTARVAALTTAMGLAQLENRKPLHLSGGERQRVALARALAPAPELLILDEPFSSLNEALRRELWALLKELQQTYGVAMLIVTHDLEEAFFFGEHIHALINGCLQQSGPRRQVFDRPANLQVARFLGIQNLFPVKVIHSNDESTVVDCESLGVQFAVSNDRRHYILFEEGEKLTAGIRSEFLVVNRNPGKNPHEGPRFPGRVVEVTETVRGVMLTVTPEGREGLVQVMVGFQEAASIRISDKIEVSLPARHLFLVPRP